MAVARAKYGYLFLMILLVVAIGFLHGATPGDKVFLHEIYRRLGYFPIVVAALMYGVKGGLLLAICTSLAFIPHLQHFYYLSPNIYLSELPEIILYLAAGIVAGAIAGREKRLREKYQDLSEKLERSYNRLHNETSLLIEAEEQLRASQKLSALGQLSASLAHEIKNPLAGIRGAAEILLDVCPEGHDKREFVDILLKETSRLSSTVDEVLHFSRVKHNPLPQKTNLEPLADVLGRVFTLLDNQLRKKRVQLKVEIPEQLGKYSVDGDKMAQVFINILLNACQAVELDGKIRIRVEQRNGELAVNFTDNGPGIPEEERGKIFAPFYSNREDGTGLGLTISSRIIESYGGSIILDETPEGGACFSVLLPTP